MRIGIFSKFDMTGGSELRCVELANGICRYTGHQSVLLAERSIPDRLRGRIRDEVGVVPEVFTKSNVNSFYQLDRLLVVNTDSRDFATLDYWQGRSSRHAVPVELQRLPSMTFLFNFIVSPARFLAMLQEHVPDIRIITANSRFFYEISQQDRYEMVRHYPRLQLESPIDPESVLTEKSPSKRVRLGMHSKSARSKWNPEMGALIKKIRVFARICG